VKIKVNLQKYNELMEKSQDLYKKAKSIIPYGRQDIDQADIDEVVNVLSSDFITQPSSPKI
jgi:hypothetical protein